MRSINHGVFVVRVLSQDFKHPLLDTCLAPVQVTDVHDAKVAEMRWQIPPREYLHSSGTTRRSRTVDCLLQWLRADLPDPIAGL